MENQENNRKDSSEEIELGQLFEFIRKGFNSLNRSFLRLYLYFRRNIVKFTVLIVVGLVVGYGLGQLVDKQLKTEIIVKPNLDSKTYLYDVISEIEANIKSKDTAFFNKLDIDVASLENFKVEIIPIEKEEVEDLTEQVKYLELLDKFRDEEGILDVVLNEINNKSVISHRIIFTYSDANKGSDAAVKLMKYINSNEYYNELVEVHAENARLRIQKNEELIDQIDTLIEIYSNVLTREGQSEATVILNDSEKLDVTGLIRIKNTLLDDIEFKKIELETKKQAIRVTSFGAVQVVQDTLLSRSLIVIPALFVLIAILIDIIVVINRKASELQ